MEKAYIILVHKNPNQLYRLLNRLDDNNSTFFIHIDIKTSISDFKELENFGSKVIYVERENGNWGKFGIVQAAINGLKAIKNTNKQYDYIHLLSGQDYPIKSNSYIDNYLTNSPNSLFITSFGALPLKHWKNGGFDRINKYFLGITMWRKYLGKIVNLSIFLFPFLRKKIPYGLTIYGGSQWWTINMYALNFILSYIEDHPQIIKFFKYSLLPDEMFFQTILLNSKDESIISSMAKDNKRYIIIPLHNPHPITLTTKDYDNIISSDAFFGRKFDPDIDSEILDLIDENCLTNK